MNSLLIGSELQIRIIMASGTSFLFCEVELGGQGCCLFCAQPSDETFALNSCLWSVRALPGVVLSTSIGHNGGGLCHGLGSDQGCLQEEWFAYSLGAVCYHRVLAGFLPEDETSL